MKRVKSVTGVVVGALLISGGVVAGLSWQTRQDIRDLEARIETLAESSTPVATAGMPLDGLPKPVQRYLRFVFTGAVESPTQVRLSATGQFRRPNTTGFNPTNARQVIAIGTPALMFSATTRMAPGIWASAYDYFANGEMEMKAKVLSSFTVVDETASDELNRISLRRWLLESALYPQALLPGGPVRWEPIDAHSARAVVSADGLSASMIAHFDAEGRMTHMVAEEEGDLTTPYHGSGEHVTRSDYQPVDGVMIPMAFTISRAAGGEIYPFWEGRVTAIEFL